MKTDLLNFTVGPVMSTSEILAIGAEQIPYFRTAEFSKVMYENEQLMLKFTNAPSGARAVFITGSGTASMEAVVMNVFNNSDKLLVIDGGSFGHRFTQLCEIHGINYDSIKPKMGYPVTADMLKPYEGKGYTGLLVNIHETSTGVHYDPTLIGDFCRRNNMIYVIDAISSFLADKLDMTAVGANVVITGSQKVLACPPGISIIVLDSLAIDRIIKNDVHIMYLNLKDALKNGERGQTPFTPAVGILLQINARLHQIDANGGVQAQIDAIRLQAEDFRTKVAKLPFEIVSHSMSNALTPLHPLNASAYDIFLELKENYGIWICPNGGETKDKIFRVGHFGAQGKKENDILISALEDLQKKGKI